jgi:hypothetical protein
MEDPYGVLASAYAYAIGGVFFDTVARTADSGSSSSWARNLVRTNMPGRHALEAYDFFTDSGRYKDLSVAGKFKRLLKTYQPGADNVTFLAGAVSLIRTNYERDVAIKAYWKWRRENVGGGMSERATDPQGGIAEGIEAQKRFRIAARAAADAMNTDQPPEKIAELLRGAAEAGRPTKEKPKGFDLAASLRGRRLLSQIGQRNWGALRKAIGARNYQELVDHDQMLAEWAKFYD